MRKMLLLACGLVVTGSLLAGQMAQQAQAELKDAAGKGVGTAMLMDTPHGVLITVKLSGLPAGGHALHVHAVGKCEPPFDSAGGHFNPAAAVHGYLQEKGPHAGDLPNIHVMQGTLNLEVLAPEASLASGPNAVLDADGAALVVHAATDDYKTDPAGGAGARIACGVIMKGAGM